MDKQEFMAGWHERVSPMNSVFEGSDKPQSPNLPQVGFDARIHLRQGVGLKSFKQNRNIYAK